MWRHAFVIACTCLATTPVLAGDADVIGVKARLVRPGTVDFDVTVRSRDTGWERYADRLEALTPDGRVLATRVLDHPHETEQPFTRDLYGVPVPTGVGQIRIRAHFKPGGYGGEELVVVVPRGKQ